MFSDGMIGPDSKDVYVNIEVCPPISTTKIQYLKYNPYKFNGSTHYNSISDIQNYQYCLDECDADVACTCCDL